MHVNIPGATQAELSELEDLELWLEFVRLWEVADGLTKWRIFFSIEWILLTHHPEAFMVAHRKEVAYLLAGVLALLIVIAIV